MRNTPSTNSYGIEIILCHARVIFVNQEDGASRHIKIPVSSLYDFLQIFIELMFIRRAIENDVT
jgi:hypothetical protein